MSRTTDLLLVNMEARENEITDILDSHDCHFSPMDGCTCEPLREELAHLRGEHLADWVENDDSDMERFL